MKRLLAAIVAGLFAVAATVPVIAQEKKADTSKMTDAQKADAKKKADPVAAACKGKKPGDEVTVDKKKVKCPAPKKEMKKDEMKKEMKKDEMKK